MTSQESSARNSFQQRVGWAYSPTATFAGCSRAWWAGTPTLLIPSRARSRRRGLSLIEAVIALAITATLLTALAAAFHASAQTVANNNSFFRCTQTARLTLDDIVTELRQADSVQVDDSGSRVRLIRPRQRLTEGEIDREYAYDPAARRITLQIFYADAKESPVYELAGNISACEFGAPDANGGKACIPISLTCSDGSASVSLHGAVTPRRAER
ncbi:MAG TPA: prepilin-type N-terminal cleavage/methylation domain-containing protein [Tepidisphaeraceae bacterium]|nr:prepilin-type N-terminal cleavage/methylation domain-containing protein [Tepidisphaeraceae bacterium]